MAAGQQRWRRVPTWAWVVGAVVVVGAIGAQMPDPTGAPVAIASPSASTPAARATPEPEPSREAPAAPVIDAAKIEADVLEALGVDSWQDACDSSPDGWACYVADMSAVSDSTLIVSLQITEKGKELGERAGVALLNLVGSDHPGLAWVQVNNAAGKVLANVSRADAPLVRDYPSRATRPSRRAGEPSLCRRRSRRHRTATRQVAASAREPFASTWS